MRIMVFFVVNLTALFYLGLALRHFMQRRLSFAAHLSSNSAFTTSRYLRLMAMSATQMVWSISMTIYALWFNLIAGPIRPWTTWSDVHSDWLRIDTFLEEFTPPFILKTFCVLWWVVPASTLLFVAFFSFGKDALDEYKKCFSWFKTHVLRRPSSKGPFKKFILSSKFVHSFVQPLRCTDSQQIFFRNDSSLKISSPTLIASSHGGTDLSMLSAKELSSPNSIYKHSSVTNNSVCDTFSEISHYPPPMPYHYQVGKAIGSLSDLSVYPETPSTAVPPYAYADVIQLKSDAPPSPPLPLTPPPTRAQRIRELTMRTQPPVPTSPRPFTYPSKDPLHDSIDPSTLQKS